jgi:hypothetical protein
MKISFTFENGTGLMLLTPENNRDKQLLDLCVDGRPSIRIKPTTKECTILEFSEPKPKVEVVAPVATEEVVDATTDNPGEQGLLGRADETLT